MESVKVYCEGRTELLYIYETKLSLKRIRAAMFAVTVFCTLECMFNISQFLV